MESEFLPHQPESEKCIVSREQQPSPLTFSRDAHTLFIRGGIGSIIEALTHIMQCPKLNGISYTNGEARELGEYYGTRFAGPYEINLTGNTITIRRRDDSEIDPAMSYAFEATRKTREKNPAP